MRVAFLCKRRYMSKDVILDRYARLYEIPRQLALLGNDVLGMCLGYYPSQAVDRIDDASNGRLRWIAPRTGTLRLPTVIAYPFRALGMLRKFQPEILIGASDAPHAVLTRWLARRLGVPYAIDLYDNFESFSLTRIPGMLRAYRNAVREAALVTTTSAPLRDYVLAEYGAQGEVVAMPSTIDKALFHPRDRQSCRSALGLPAQGRLIGTAGGLYRDKGITDLYAAWPLLRDRDPDVHLVLAGPHEAGLPPPSGPRVHYLAALPHDKVAVLFSALDVGVMCIRDTPFGRYCFPQKAYEMLACDLPVVAASVGAMRELFGAMRQTLYASGNPTDLADKITHQLRDPERCPALIDDWPALVADLERRLRTALRRSPLQSLSC